MDDFANEVRSGSMSHGRVTPWASGEEPYGRGTLIAHVTDAHVAPFGRPMAALKHRSVEVLADLAAQVASAGADSLLLGGDNIDNRGHGEADLDALLRVLRPLDGRWFAQFGNHEAACARSGRLDKYAFAAAVDGRGVGPGQPDFSVAVGDVRVIGIDTTLVGSPSGFVAPDTLRFLAREVEQAEEPHVVVLGHHPLVPAWAPHALDGWDREYLVANREMVNAYLASAPKVRAYLCGHHHASRIQRVQGRGRSGGYYHILTASPIAYPHVARWLRFTGDALVVTPLVPRLPGLIEEGAAWVQTGRKAQRYAQLGSSRPFLEYLRGGDEDTAVVLPFETGRRPHRAASRVRR